MIIIRVRYSEEIRAAYLTLLASRLPGPIVGSTNAGTGARLALFAHRLRYLVQAPSVAGLQRPRVQWCRDQRQ